MKLREFCLLTQLGEQRGHFHKCPLCLFLERVMKSKILIGSVFANDSVEQQRWLDLQLKYLAETTSNYDHIAVVMSGITNDYFSSRTRTIVPENTSETASDAHLIGLRLLKQEFDNLIDQYDYFLFLDGDAFPIKKNWVTVLINSLDNVSFDDHGMALPNKTKKVYEIAVALRSENLETRLHCSILFAKKCALKYLSFDDGLVGLDLQGNPESDIHISYQKERRPLAFPLVRTNQYNVHPLACGIYFDMFYHHCCGSGRTFNLRAKKYISRIAPNQDLGVYTDRLMNSADEFVHKLAGWNPLKYAKVTNGAQEKS